MAMSWLKCFGCGDDDDGDARGKQPVTGGKNDNRNKRAGDLEMATFPDRRTELISAPEIQVWEIPLDELKDITNNFGEDTHMGDGSYGKVYHGVLQNRKLAAIKKLYESDQPVRAFRAQVGIASTVKHPNVTELLGYCIDGNYRVLVYEFATIGTLHQLLHREKDIAADTTGAIFLSWDQRVQIAAEAARGLDYLHEDVQVVHRSIKSANILLFDGFRAKIADFDLTNQSADPMPSKRLTGSYTYPAPEFAVTGKLTSKSDVYSFGVVLLELLTGRKAFDPTSPKEQRNLAIWAGPLLSTRISECIDPRMKRGYPPAAVEKFAALAASCIEYDPDLRPSMTTVRKRLDELLSGERVGSST